MGLWVYVDVVICVACRIALWPSWHFQGGCRRARVGVGHFFLGASLQSVLLGRCVRV